MSVVNLQELYEKGIGSKYSTKGVDRDDNTPNGIFERLLNCDGFIKSPSTVVAKGKEFDFISIYSKDKDGKEIIHWISRNNGDEEILFGLAHWNDIKNYKNRQIGPFLWENFVGIVMCFKEEDPNKIGDNLNTILELYNDGKSGDYTLERFFN